MTTYVYVVVETEYGPGVPDEVNLIKAFTDRDKALGCAKEHAKKYAFGFSHKVETVEVDDE